MQTPISSHIFLTPYEAVIKTKNDEVSARFAVALHPDKDNAQFCNTPPVSEFQKKPFQHIEEFLNEWLKTRKAKVNF